VAHHLVRERVVRGEIKVQYVSTRDMLADLMPADLFTKALAKPKHEEFCGRLGLVDV
jgi:hypothetical protein